MNTTRFFAAFALLASAACSSANDVEDATGNTHNRDAAPKDVPGQDVQGGADAASSDADALSDAGVLDADILADAEPVTDAAGFPDVSAPDAAGLPDAGRPDASLPPAPVRDLARYRPRDVFVVSDADPDAALMTVPLAVLRQGDAVSAVYPYLAVHVEPGRFDADSVLAFLARYGAERVLTPGLPSGLVTELTRRGHQVQVQNGSDRLAFWSSAPTVVFAGGSVEGRLIAAWIAALEGSPLVIAGTAADTPAVFSGKKVLRMGAPCPAQAGACVDLWATTSAWIDDVLSKRPELCRNLLLFAPNDALDSAPVTSPPLITDFGSASIEHLFEKTSLVAPYLAAARSELMAPVRQGDVATAKTALAQAIEVCHLRSREPETVTIVASHEHIALQNSNGTIREAVDMRELANTDLDPFVELSAGRIMGFTVSDASALVARSLFYRALNPPARAAIAWPKERYYNRIEAAFLERRLAGAGLTVDSRYDPLSFDPASLASLSYLFFFGHGDTTQFWNVMTVSDLTQRELPPMIVGPVGCNSCDPVGAPAITSLMCLQFVRHGAAVFIGASEGVAAGYNDMALFMNGLLEGKGVGAAYRDSTNLGVANEYAWHHALGIDPAFSSYFSQFVLGDPLLTVPIRDPTFQPAQPAISAPDAQHRQVSFQLPAEPSLGSVRVAGDRIFVGPFGLETQRARGFAPPITDGIPSYFEDRVITAVPVPIQDPALSPVVVSVSATVDGEGRSVTQMPLDQCNLMLGLERFINVWPDRHASGATTWYLTLLEQLGGTPPRVTTDTDIAARAYQISLEVRRN